MQSGRSAAPVVAIVGATGAVGIELLGCLERRNFPMSELRLFASARSAGKTLPFRGQPLPVRELTRATPPSPQHPRPKLPDRWRESACGSCWSDESATAA